MGPKWGPNFESDGDLMGTFASRNGDPKSVFLKIDQKKLISWNTEEKHYETNLHRFNFTDKLAWCSFKLVLSSQVFKWSTFNRQWLLWLLARSSAWNRENGDLGKKMGTFWGPKNWKRSPWGPGSPNGDPLGSSAIGAKHPDLPLSLIHIWRCRR